MTRPEWLDPALYPFASHTLDLGAGRLHYLDEGTGTPVVMVHGTPSWSFLYRHLISDLSSEYRCVAPDNLGFGLSDKPAGFAYTPAAHAENLTAFVNTLGLKDIVLVVHDFGGPIGLSYALQHPENVRALVVMNTWLWHNRPLEQAGKLLANGFGKFLYKQLNFEALLLRLIFADKVLTKDLLAHYLGPFPTPASREPLFALVNSIEASNAWFDTLWAEREAIADKPALLVWGTKDKLVPVSFLMRWQEMFTKAETVELDAGHFVQEEASERVGRAVGEFLKTVSANP